MLGHTYGLAGREEEAREILDYLLERSQTRFVPLAQIAVVLIGMGEDDEAFALLEQAFDEGHYWGLDRLRAERWCDPIRDDPRFEALLARLRFPD